MERISTNMEAEAGWDFQPARLLIHRCHLGDKCCILLPCPKQYAGWNMLIPALTCKCFRGEAYALSRLCTAFHI